MSEIQGFCCYGHLPGIGSDFLPNPNGSTPPNMETPPTGLRGEEPDEDDWGSLFEGLEVEENKSSSSSDFGDPNKFGFWDVSDLECFKKESTGILLLKHNVTEQGQVQFHPLR